MDPGWLDVCIRESNVSKSIAFYLELGFRAGEWNLDDGWSVLVEGDRRIGVFGPKYMSDSFSLNFRGGNIEAIAHGLTAAGVEFSSPPKIRENGGGSFDIRDPDGNLIFFDSCPNETKPE
jgi:catechol 2,3-dioxygenase-like lactoylglutathione lyase family enzyme